MNQSQPDISPDLEPDHRPELKTERLWLRPFQLSDAESMEQQINDRDIARNTRTIEYPYPQGAAAEWIEKHLQLWREGQAVVFAITDRTSGALMGAIGLTIEVEHQRAELGFWLGRTFRNQGYCSEAARAVVEFGFRELALHRIYASYFVRNPASGKVMQKIGMQYEGLFRGHVRKWGVFEDVIYCGMRLKDLI